MTTLNNKNGSNDWEKDRQKTFESIRKTFMDIIVQTSGGTTNKPISRMNKTEFVRYTAQMQYYIRMSSVAADLAQGKHLGAVYNRVAAKGELPKGGHSDLAKRDGAYSAFEDMQKIIDSADRNFDRLYVQPARGLMTYLQQQYKANPLTVERDYKKMWQRFHPDTINTIRHVVLAMQQQHKLQSKPEWPDVVWPAQQQQDAQNTLKRPRPPAPKR